MRVKKGFVGRGRVGGRRRVLVTGGAGFVGSHLSEALVGRGFEVSVLDDLSTGRRENLARLEGSAGFSVVVGDVTDEGLVEEVAEGHDVIFHLAAAVGVRLILADPIQSFRTNVLGTESVLRAAQRHGAKVLVASTSEVYGKVASLPQREDDDVLLGPSCYSRWSYAACKMLDEFIGLAYARQGLGVVVFRLFNTVGPRQTGRYGMVVPRFADAALAGEAVPVHGDGGQTRCFLHVRDAVEAIQRLEAAPGAVGRVFNVGSTESVSIRELAERMLVHAGRAGDPEGIRLVPYAEAYPNGDFEDIRDRMPCIDRIHEVTGWRPRRSLDEIIADVVAYKTMGELAPAETAPVPAFA